MSSRIASLTRSGCNNLDRVQSVPQEKLFFVKHIRADRAGVSVAESCIRRRDSTEVYQTCQRRGAKCAILATASPSKCAALAAKAVWKVARTKRLPKGAGCCYSRCNPFGSLPCTKSSCLPAFFTLAIPAPRRWSSGRFTWQQQRDPANPRNRQRWRFFYFQP